MLERKKKKLESYTYKEKSNNNKEDRSFLCGVKKKKKLRW